MSRAVTAGRMRPESYSLLMWQAGATSFGARVAYANVFLEPMQIAVFGLGLEPFFRQSTTKEVALLPPRSRLSGLQYRGGGPAVRRPPPPLALRLWQRDARHSEGQLGLDIGAAAVDWHNPILLADRPGPSGPASLRGPDGLRYAVAGSVPGAACPFVLVAGRNKGASNDAPFWWLSLHAATGSADRYKGRSAAARPQAPRASRSRG